MFDKLRELVSIRFLKFCTVGASGVLVNLGLLACFADGFDIHVNLASALAIELSINSNFVINELWTFRDRRSTESGIYKRWLKFHTVSAVGAGIQWSVFVICNTLWVSLLPHVEAYAGAEAGFLTRYIIEPIAHPPDVGHLKYVSQLLGIGAATFWNYLANFYWTWKSPTEGSAS